MTSNKQVIASVLYQRTAMGRKKDNRKSKVNENNSLVKQEEQQSEIVLLYCESEFCDGEPIEAIPIKDKEELECPICYCSLNKGKIAVLDACKHVYCQVCVASWDKQNK